ncbi:PP2C family protein-serine/threonine phosphatase [Pedobacter sp. JCM 36344]|uniref:PP2C family protein-serine/threonine phosphatase n=1 Tax=Pedobacter sp. JCM 36344 TaxID=3374280 RepID=UPI00397A92E2
MDKNYFGITDTGKVRSNNEDTFIAEITAANDFVIACVIDGVGGYSGGEIAAEIAKFSVLEHLSKPSGDLLKSMKTAIGAANSKIIAEKLQDKELENMACVLTLAVIDLKNNLFYYAHVGDTRLYLLRDNSLVKITKDQSFVGFMEDSGRLTEEQAMKHPKRNEINKALGFVANVTEQGEYIETGQSPFLPGDLLLLCSDGLSDMVNRQELTTILITENDLEYKASELISAANQSGGLDNITVVLVSNTNKKLVYEATKPGQATMQIPKRKKQFLAEPEIPYDEAEVFQRAELIPESVSPLEIHTNIEESGQKSGKALIVLLSVLCIVFIGTTAYLYWLYNNHPSTAVQPKRLTEITEKRNTKEIMLQDTLNKLQGQILVLSDSLFPSPIILHQPLTFNKDTIYLRAEKELVIISDSLYKGIAIDIKPKSKFIQLRNIAFENFNTAISTSNNALVLRNVKFSNCPNAVQNIYNLEDKKYVNGKIPLSSFSADSLPIKPTE